MHNIKLNASIIKRIDELRIAQDLSWNNLARISDVPRSTLHEIKNGSFEAKFSTLCKLAIGFNMTLQEFLDFDIDLSEFEV